MTKLQKKRSALSAHIESFIDKHGGKDAVAKAIGYSPEGVRLWTKGNMPNVESLLALHGLGMSLNLDRILGGK